MYNMEPFVRTNPSVSKMFLLQKRGAEQLAALLSAESNEELLAKRKWWETLKEKAARRVRRLEEKYARMGISLDGSSREAQRCWPHFLLAATSNLLTLCLWWAAIILHAAWMNARSLMLCPWCWFVCGSVCVWPSCNMIVCSSFYCMSFWNDFK